MVAQELLDGISSLGQAVGYLFRGEFDRMLVSLLQGATVVGVFLIIMFLMKFVLEITIFKSDEHKKYATWMGVGIALIGVLNDSLFLLIYRVFAGSLPLLLLVILAVFAVMIFVNKLRKSNYEGLTEMRGAATEAIVARKDLKKEDHDLHLQEKMEKREIDGIKKAEHIVDHELSTIRNLQQLVQQLRQLLGQLAQITDANQAQQVRLSLMRGAQGLPTLINQEYVDEQELIKIIIKLEQSFFLELKLDGDEEAIFAHFHAHLLKQLIQEHKVGEDEARSRLLSLEQQIKNILAQAKRIDEERRALVEQLKQIDRAELSQTQQMREAVNQLISFLNAGDSNGALQQLAIIDQLLNTETAESRKLKELLLREQQLSLQHQQLNLQLKKLLRLLTKTEKQEKNKLDHDVQDERDSWRKLVTAVKEAETAQNSPDFSAKLSHLNAVLADISTKEGHDNTYLQKVSMYLAKSSVNSQVTWHHK